MRFEEKQRALALRRQGWSYNDILKEVGVSKSTLSLWLRDVPLADEQIAALEGALAGPTVHVRAGPLHRRGQ